MAVNKVNLEEHTIRSEVIASGGMLTVKRDQVRLPNGHQSQREFVLHPGAVVVVPLLDNGNIIFERQFRYPLHQVFIELPAGKIDPNETILTTGQRELLEETGYTANQWVKLGLQHPCIGYSNEVIHMYLARGLTLGQHQRDIDETLEVFEMSLSQCMQMILDGEITDGKTIVAMLFAEKYLTQHG
ncbi:NTP pyrophosphohydrolase [Methylophilaceae bacterium 11]|uniref:NUDIX domain-containing protein n=1 Tax=Methylotenera sp. 1P/1 TaxID=1131551 RepID=UPI00036F91E7|nr:NUDIX hydrolase [Methylotenera sp. 1P/1]EUJ10863.1 NTP pyrophosphohydrolase [Methylophilaceae bacterium 11]